MPNQTQQSDSGKAVTFFEKILKKAANFTKPLCLALYAIRV
jgi:hypothetical protein